MTKKAKRAAAGNAVAGGQQLRLSPEDRPPLAEFEEKPQDVMSDEIRWEDDWWGWPPRQLLLRVLREGREMTVEEVVDRLYLPVPHHAINIFDYAQPRGRRKKIPLEQQRFYNALPRGRRKELPLELRHCLGVAMMVRDMLVECLLRGEVSQSSRDGKTTYVACVEPEAATDAGEKFGFADLAGEASHEVSNVEPEAATDAGEKFGFADLSREARDEVFNLARKIKELGNRSAQSLLEIGRHLIAAKNHLPHGLFGRWLDEEFRWTTRQAERFMTVAGVFGECDSLSFCGPAALYLLAAHSTPEAARQEALATAAAGEQVTHARAKEIVSRHRRAGPRKGKARAAAGDAGPRQEQVQGAAALDVVGRPAAAGTTALAEQEMGVAAVAEEEPAVQERPAGKAEAVAPTTPQHGSARLILEALAMQLECYAADARRAVLLPEHEHGRELEKLLDRIAATLARARAGEPL
jgi:hypothetical protein